MRSELLKAFEASRPKYMGRYLDVPTDSNCDGGCSGKHDCECAACENCETPIDHDSYELGWNDCEEQNDARQALSFTRGFCACLLLQVVAILVVIEFGGGR